MNEINKCLKKLEQQQKKGQDYGSVDSTAVCTANIPNGRWFES